VTARHCQSFPPERALRTPQTKPRWKRYLADRIPAFVAGVLFYLAMVWWLS
jgi:hypothetical protein